MATILKKGGVYYLPLSSELGELGRLQFRIKSIEVTQKREIGKSDRIESLDINLYPKEDFNYDIEIEGLIKYGKEHLSGAMITPEYLLEKAILIEGEELRQAHEIIDAWLEI